MVSDMHQGNREHGELVLFTCQRYELSWLFG
ncbi:hypothetical protein PPTG_21661 [Phytophthora nicotianae INRA-310]|uniref:Uncharacterized protein n=2 Tax=Phytophthora nicotianae TaxID=4792 RepID=W2QX38_PHYN3|nr:hypothetical protein PPTG_21661 [Phytophthora nicotianae INRA-310]ETI34280.1 hypothetical protein F443_19186 [Phytophthora nicotianae P1569]ETN17506.1 hypothetical protein PPTG_21661 [Phytophthora nicotianae INRA-310]